MKRMQDRDGSPRSKRSRSGYPGPDHESSRDRLSPDMDRRGREPKPKPYRDFDPHEMDYVPRGKYRGEDRMSDDGFPPMRTEARTPEYRSLCLSNISSKIPDMVLKDTLYREFKKFGEFNVNITYSGDQRVAYINFRYPEDARVAKHAKSKMLLFERPVRFESVYNRRRSSSPGPDMGRDYGGNRGGGYGRNSSPPPMMNMHHGGGGRDGRRENIGRYQGNNRDMMPRNDRGGGGGDMYGPPSFPNKSIGSGGPGSTAGLGQQRRAPNEKFPYHLDHINPEDDDKATRTLFVGNLDYNIELGELHQIFDRYGRVEDIDIKRPQRGQGNAYAFIKYLNLDCAHRAKVEMSGQYVGRFQCKIGYGKVTPTTCLWVGGLGPWVTHQALEREFDRFGVIDRIVWPHGKNFAYVLYDNIDAATAACQEMRGFPFGGKDRRLRVDFADINHVLSPRPEQSMDNERNPPWRQSYDGPSDGGPPRRRDDWQGDPVNSYRNPDNPRDSDMSHRNPDWDAGSERNRRGRTPEAYSDRSRRRSRTPDNMYDMKDRYRENGRHMARSQERDFGNDRDNGRRYDDRRMPPEDTDRHIEMVDNIQDMSKCLHVAWNGALILKSSAFPARMHVVSGDVMIVDHMMRDPCSTETSVLKIKQRLRLDQPKLEDVGRRVSGAGPHGHCILLAMTSTLQNYEDTSVQQRPLKNLVTYLRQKDAAGVISLPNYETKDKENVGVLYAFPPCQFGNDYLLNRAPRLPQTPTPSDDYLVIVVIKGAA